MMKSNLRVPNFVKHPKRILCGLTVALLSTGLHGQNQTWILGGNATSGNWSISENWDPAGIPDSNSADLTFGAAADSKNIFLGDPAGRTVRSINITADVDNFMTLRTTTTDTNATAADLKLDGGGNGASINVANGADGNLTIGNAGGNVTLADNLSVTNYLSSNASRTLTINRVINETGGNRTLDKFGPGDLTISTASTYSGNVTIHEGSITVAGSNRLGSSGKTLHLNGGRLFVNGMNTGSSITEKFIISNNAASVLEFTGNDTFTVSGGTGNTQYPVTLNSDLKIVNSGNAIDRRGAIVLSARLAGPGKVIFESNNDMSSAWFLNRVQVTGPNSAWNGGWQIRKGAMNFGNSNAAGTGLITIGYDGGTEPAGLYVTPGFTYANNFNVASGTNLRGLRAEGAGNTTFSGNIALNSNLTVDFRSGAATNFMQLSGNLSGNGGVILTRSLGSGDDIVFSGLQFLHRSDARRKQRGAAHSVHGRERHW
jgi:autotransporter-associated beta strand protein